ncbi:MAG: DUF2284 domain-containing protein [Desulfobacterales bacterium]
MISDPSERSAPVCVRQIQAFVDPEKRKEDLDCLVRAARDLGALKAAVLDAEDIRIDQTIRAKAASDDAFPSIHRPLIYPKDNIEEAIYAYQKALFFTIDPESDMPVYGGGPILDQNHRAIYVNLFDIVSRVESAAFYMGYHLVIGLATGNCRSVFCFQEKRCAAMIKGGRCLHPYRGRPAMDAVGIDAGVLAEKHFTQPVNRDKPVLAGLVFVT